MWELGGCAFPSGPFHKIESSFDVRSALYIAFPLSNKPGALQIDERNACPDPRRVHLSTDPPGLNTDGLVLVTSVTLASFTVLGHSL